MKLLDWTHRTNLPTGGELRSVGPDGARVVVLLVGGGTGHSAPGKWSASMTWLAPRIARAVGPGVRVAQLRYRDTSWNLLDGSIVDVRAALAHEAARDVPPERVVLVALSMGGATCLANAGHPLVVGIVGIAPWLPEEIPVDGLAGKRLLVVHGTLDNALPFVPGVSLDQSRLAVRRARGIGADAEWRGVPLGLHGLGVRVRGRIRRMPRAGAYARLVVPEVGRLVDGQPASSGSLVVQ